jgi:glycopeptide antibiotics resistance protein
MESLEAVTQLKSERDCDTSGVTLPIVEHSHCFLFNQILPSLNLSSNIAWQGFKFELGFFLPL